METASLAIATILIRGRVSMCLAYPARTMAPRSGLDEIVNPLPMGSKVASAREDCLGGYETSEPIGRLLGISANVGFWGKEVNL